MEPFGSMVEDFRAGLAPAMTVRVNTSGEDDPIGPLDFFPWTDRGGSSLPAPLPEPDDEYLLATHQINEQEFARRKIEALARRG